MLRFWRAIIATIKIFKLSWDMAKMAKRANKDQEELYNAFVEHREQEKNRIKGIIDAAP